MAIYSNPSFMDMLDEYLLLKEADELDRQKPWRSSRQRQIDSNHMSHLRSKIDQKMASNDWPRVK